MRYSLRSLISVYLAMKVLIYIKLGVASVADTIFMSYNYIHEENK